MKANARVDDLQLLHVLQQQRNNALLAASREKDQRPITPDTAFVIGLFVFDFIIMTFVVLAVMVWGSW